MKITKLHIIGFGKLKNFQMDLSQGLNVIYGKNEQGKSTLMAFIKAVFYGFPSSGKSISGNERKKYTPWDGSQMGGTIYFEYNGASYSLQRTFGVRKSLDKVNLWNLNKGEQVELPNKTEVGEYLFEISLNTFENTTYIGQLGNIINASKDKSGEIINKLTNLVSTGEEDVSFKETEKRIKEAMTDLVAARGSGGKLNNEKNNLNELQELRNTAIDNDIKKSQLKRYIEDLKNKIQDINDKIKFQSDLYNQQCNLRKLKELNAVIEKKNIVNEEENNIKIISEKLIRQDFNIDEEYLENIKKQLQLFLKEREVYKSKKEDYDNTALKLSELEKTLNEYTGIKEVNIEHIRQLKSIISNISNLSQSIEGIQVSLSKAEASLANLNSDKTKSESSVKSSIALIEDEISRLLSETENINIEINKAEKAVEEADKRVNNFNMQETHSRLTELSKKLKLYENEKNNNEAIVSNISEKHSAAMGRTIEARSNVKSEEAVAKVKLDAINSEMEKEINNLSGNKSSTKVVFIIASIVIAAISMLSGIFVNPIFYLGIIISVILFIIGGKNNKNHNKSDNIKEQLKNNAEKKKKAILSSMDSVKDAEHICSKEEAEILNELNKAEQELQYIKTNFDNVKAEINIENNKIEKVKLNLEMSQQNLQRESAILNEKKNLYNENKVQIENAKKKLDNEKIKLAEISLKWKESINNAEELILSIKDQSASAKDKLKDYIAGLKIFNDSQSPSQIIDFIKQSINESLIKCRCNSTDELVEKQTKLRSLTELINDMKSELELKEQSLCSEKESETNMSDNLFSLVGKYKEPNSIGDINNYINEIENLLSMQKEEYSGKQIAEQILQNALNGRSIQDVEIEISNTRQKLLEGNFNILPDELSDEEFNDIKDVINCLQQEMNDTKDKITMKEAELNLSFKDAKSVSDIDGLISSVNEKINDMEYYYQCLDIASSVFNEAFSEMQKNFGPALNRETSAILNEITKGRYKELLVAKNFDVSIADPSSSSMHLWEYLSGGTADQVYFSLRLAITRLLTENKESMPVLLDDAFMQYDDERAYEAISFLSSLVNSDSDKNNSLQQVILFTCHSKISELAKSFNETNMILLSTVECNRRM
ncbi:AAA family ATPase [Clostridium sp. JN-9]|uniref:AAA family ATPase n=1 Tax=Clostridium sp. JN-9 TaxID=2507159 RepID=UPI000FFDFED0|nr:AAA family ATPase [Clostridium sp. JN-9]QAT40482.1 hypothetical protein EQM05_09520 [Clostridium sp. JN-9]